MLITDVRLREVRVADLPELFDMQADPESVAMAGVPARDAEAYLRHWGRAAADPTVVWRVLDAGGEVAGVALSFVEEGKRMVGYWVARPFWGRGLATRALELLLAEIDERPLFATVLHTNRGSRRVLEKCGFENVGFELYRLG